MIFSDDAKYMIYIYIGPVYEGHRARGEGAGGQGAGGPKKKKRLLSLRSKRKRLENLIPFSSWGARLTYGWLVPQVQVS